MPPSGRVSDRLGGHYWGPLAELRALAESHPDGFINLTVGSPVDPVPAVVGDALARAADQPGYPLTAGTPRVRESIVAWLGRRFGVDNLDPSAVLPVPGTKEVISSLALHLGVGPGDLVVIPDLAYPSYRTGADLVGARTFATDALTRLGPERPRLVWVNSPSNPTGRTLPVAHLRKMLDWCRERGAILVSDECYLEFGWDVEPVSALHRDIAGPGHEGLLVINSLSKRSNLAGYRSGFVAGDPALIDELLVVRRELGLAMPGPQQAVTAVAFDDDEHVEEQRGRYRRRRTVIIEALTAAGLRIEHSESGLYVWATADEDAWDTTRRLAELGVLVAPGTLYGGAGARHVRLALTATDDRIDRAAERISRMRPAPTKDR